MSDTLTNKKKVRKDEAMKTGNRILLAALSVAVLLHVGCGSKSAPTPPPPGGGTESLAVFLKDAPADAALSVQVTITSVTATTSTGQTVTLTDTPRTYELKHLSLAPTLASMQNMNSGSYKNISLSLTNPQMQTLDVNGNLKTLDATTTPSITLAQNSVTVPVSFSLANKSNGGVVIDFDVAKSLSVDNQANFVLTPTGTAVVSNSTDLIPHLTNCVGTVISLAKDGSGFGIQLVESGATVNVTADSNTFYDATVQKLSNISVGEILELSALLQTNGNYLAKAINSSATSLTARQQGIATGTYTNDSGQTLLSVAPQN